jgi:hypothetical protein
MVRRRGEFFRSGRYGNLLSTMADAAIRVHPDALGDPTAWNAQADLPFFDALLSALGQSLGVDDARVFATGHSSGGFFTNPPGCQRGNVPRAIAPVSAGGPFRFGEGGCTGDVAVWLAHAEKDETVPFDSGVDFRDRWLRQNDGSDTTSPAAPSPCVQYAGCGDGLPVRWCVYQDGHNWPDFAPEGIWSFFSGLDELARPRAAGSARTPAPPGRRALFGRLDPNGSSTTPRAGGPAHLRLGGGIC